MILAAGRGARLEPLSRTTPKALLPILDRPLVDRQLEALRACGVRSVTLVVRHLAEQLRAHLVGWASELQLAFVEQPEPRGIADALACASTRLEQPFLCVLGDVFFEASDLARVARGLASADAALGVAPRASPAELARNFGVQLDAGGWVEHVEEKPRGAQPGPKGVGLYAFRPDFLTVARATPASALRGEHELTDAIERYLALGKRVRAVPCYGRDFNLSGPADLLAANLHALERTGRSHWSAPSAVIEPGAELEHAVVLAGARVTARARLERVLVFPGEQVPAGDHRDCVFALGTVLRV